MSKVIKDKNASAEETPVSALSGVEADGGTVGDAPPAVVLRDGWFWAGERRFNTRLKAETCLKELKIEN